MLKRAQEGFSAEKDGETRLRLLNAAGGVFAEKGFRAATVREICGVAGANVAAVNYHFGDKERLYSEVLRYSHACAMSKHPAEVPGGWNPEQRLRAFITSFLRRVFDGGQPAWHEKLMSREMVEPTGALDDLVHQEIQPRYRDLGEIIRGIGGKNSDENLVRHCVQSVVAQCVFYHHARPMLERLEPSQQFDKATVEERAEYIYRFSLAAIRAMAAGREFQPPGGDSGRGQKRKKRNTERVPRTAASAESSL
jgi:AcrR family transcriptional regulator